MEGYINPSNSNIELESSPLDPFQSNSSTFLNSHYTIQISGSPAPHHRNNYFQSFLEEPYNSNFDEKPGEYVIEYDIFGNSIPRTQFSSPLPRYSNNRSYEFAHGTLRAMESPQEMEIIEPEISEWEAEKENIDPKGNLTTPYKSKRTPNAMTNSMTGISTSGRSPLHDITPPIAEKRKSIMKNSMTGIEVSITFSQAY